MDPKIHRTLLSNIATLLLIGAFAAALTLKAEAPITEPAIGEIAVIIAYGSPCDVMHVLSAYQVGSEIWASTTLETPSQGCLALATSIATQYSQQIRIKAPSLVVRGIGNFNLSEEEWEIWYQEYANNQKLLYRYGKITSTYDPGLGTGWANTLALGWAYVTFYPHIYITDLGWFYIEEGPIMTNRELYILRYGNDYLVDIGDSYELNTYSLWNETYGWIMANSLTRPYVYQYSTQSWISLSPAAMVTGGAE